MPTRWINQSQPQQLVNATILFYINAAFAILALVEGSTPDPLPLIGILAGYGIANEKKWGYWTGVVVSCLTLLATVSFAFKWGTNFNLILTLLFQVVLVILVLHPISRSYQKTWFK